MRYLGFFCFVFFFYCLNIHKANASERWGYQRFSMVKPGNKLNFPSALTIHKERLEAKIKPQIGTHFLLGIDQLYHSHDRKKKIIIKQNAVPSTSKVMGKWIKLKNGVVFHYKKDGQIVAIFVQGYSGKVLKSIERVFVQNKIRPNRTASIYSLLIPCAYAQGELADGEGGWQTPVLNPAGQPNSWQNSSVESAKSDSAQSMTDCLLNKSASHVGDMATGAWDATQGAAQAVWNDPMGAAANTWNFVYGAGESVLAGVYNAGVAVTNYCMEKCLSPNQIWDDAAKGVESMYVVGQQLSGKAAEAIVSFNELDPIVRDQLICEVGGMLIAEFGVGAVVGYLTGIGAPAATARIAMVYNRITSKINNGLATLKLLGQSDLSPSQKQSMVTSFMQDQKSDIQIQSELAQLRERVAAGISSGRPQTPSPTSPPLTLPYHNIARALVDQEFEEALESIPARYRVNSANKISELKEQALGIVLNDRDLPQYSRKELSGLRWALGEIKQGLIDQDKVLDEMMPLIKAELASTSRRTKAQFDRQWELYLARRGKVSVKDVFDYDELDEGWSIDDYKNLLRRFVVDDFEDGVAHRESKAEELLSNRRYALEDKRWVDWLDEVVKPGEERAFARWAQANDYPHRTEDWANGVVRPDERDAFLEWVRIEAHTRKARQDREWEELNERVSNASVSELNELAIESEMNEGLLSSLPPVVSKGASTASQTAVIYEKLEIPIKIRSNPEASCDNCPSKINFWQHDMHFDDHIIDRAIENKSVLRQALGFAKGRNALSPEIVQSLATIARPKNTTSLWDTTTRNYILSKIKDTELTPLPLRGNTPNNRALEGKVGEYKFRIVVCESTPCKGNVISIYPICGPGVMTIAKKDKFDACLQNPATCVSQRLVTPLACK